MKGIESDVALEAAQELLFGLGLKHEYVSFSIENHGLWTFDKCERFLKQYPTLVKFIIRKEKSSKKINKLMGAEMMTLEIRSSGTEIAECDIECLRKIFKRGPDLSLTFHNITKDGEPFCSEIVAEKHLSEHMLQIHFKKDDHKDKLDSIAKFVGCKPQPFIIPCVS